MPNLIDPLPVFIMIAMRRVQHSVASESCPLQIPEKKKNLRGFKEAVKPRQPRVCRIHC
jgi:hypothetical protein